MNENSNCNCCYDKGNLIKKCDYEHHQICYNCNKEYSLRFGRRNCMFCDPHEERKNLRHSIIRPVYHNRRMSNNELYFILFGNIFFTILIMGILILIINFVVNISLTMIHIISTHDLLDIYYMNHCNFMEMRNMNIDETIYCNL